GLQLCPRKEHEDGYGGEREGEGEPARGPAAARGLRERGRRHLLELLQREGEVMRTLEALLSVLLEAAPHEPDHGGLQAGLDLEQVDRLVMQHGVHRLDRRRSTE